VRTKAAPLPGLTCRCSAAPNGEHARRAASAPPCCARPARGAARRALSPRTQDAVGRAIYLDEHARLKVVAGDGHRQNLRRPNRLTRVSALCWRRKQAQPRAARACSAPRCGLGATRLRDAGSTARPSLRRDAAHSQRLAQKVRRCGGGVWVGGARCAAAARRARGRTAQQLQLQPQPAFH
jgi:hypothetical protein